MMAIMKISRARAAALVLLLTLTLPISATAEDANVTLRDLLFREGTLDGVDSEATLLYRREAESVLLPRLEERSAGLLALSFHPGGAAARLELRQGDRSRGLGVFPTGAGNPMIMFFLESVVRDMARATGGSPFYIRNRVKEALLRPAVPREDDATGVRTVDVRPFENDLNLARMRGFGDLVLSATVSEETPGWYLRLVAEAPGPGGSAYRSSLEFERVEATK